MRSEEEIEESIREYDKQETYLVKNWDDYTQGWVDALFWLTEDDIKGKN